MNITMPKVTFGASVFKVQQDTQGNVTVEVRPDSAEEAHKYRYVLLSGTLLEDTFLSGGPTRNFGRSYLGSSFRSPQTPDELLKAAELITGLKIDDNVLQNTNLTALDVKHRLLKGLARTLCNDSVGFVERLQAMMVSGKNQLTL